MKIRIKYWNDYTISDYCVFEIDIWPFINLKIAKHNTKDTFGHTIGDNRQQKIIASNLKLKFNQQSKQEMSISSATITVSTGTKITIDNAKENIRREKKWLHI